MDSKSVIAEARETIRRIDERHRPSPVKYRDPVEVWKEEMTVLEMAREAEKEKIGFIRRLSESTAQMQRDIAVGLGAVGELAEKITDRIDGLEDELSELRTKLKIADARISDLIAARGSTESKNDSVEDRSNVLDLLNPLRRA